MSDKQVPLPSSTCIKCGAILNDATSSEPGDSDELLPEVGDVTMCVYCLRVMVYGEGMKLRDFTDEELIELIDDGTWQRLMVIREVFEKEKREHPESYPKYKP